MSFEEKTVIVTGASSGIGLAAARAFRKEKANVLMVARSKERLRVIAEEIGAKYIAIDITEKAAAEQIIGDTILEWNKIDVLVNAAGIIETGSIMNTSIDDFDKMMDELNLYLQIDDNIYYFIDRDYNDDSNINYNKYYH